MTTVSLSQNLKELGFEIQRLKTGTPPRIKASTIDYSQVKIEQGDEEVWHFSFDPGYSALRAVRVPCYLTYTNQAIHDLIRDHLQESAMYGGIVEGVGPRYCPSIEDKIVKFADKERHQIFMNRNRLSWIKSISKAFQRPCRWRCKNK